MISNHNTDFVRKIYANFKIEIFYAKKTINSRTGGRGKVGELLITNY
ncbi:hypothetical protein MENTO_v1c03130 [Mesoplasma entomophilum]|nr:hypothetical protein [Mesoplasma entomophilum]ATZ19419.1 hypothetical protein MENTO_v1c03130 [Mesoplasma entomophilum]